MADLTDWTVWHEDYDDPTSYLSQRLRTVQRHITAFLDETGTRPIRVLSVCSGDGRDLIDVLARRTDAHRVQATLLEYDERLVRRSRERAESAGLTGIEVRHIDAGHLDAYAGLLPADLVLLVGIFGNISTSDIQRVVATAPAFCEPDARLIWTRHRRAPDLTPAIREWFGEAGFAEQAFDSPEEAFSVCLERYAGDGLAMPTDAPLFSFVR
jgi:ubiquinone/menaquinone biosynthesis C-methylase UbiE